MESKGEPAQPMNEPRDIDALWDFNDPSLSEQRFREALPRVEAEAAMGDPGAIDCLLQLQTQIARSLGLQRKFDAAHATLDEVEPRLSSQTRRAAVRTLLERGRVLNSSGQKDRAAPLFLQAWELAREAPAGMDALAVDAAHMLAIVASKNEAAVWHIRALKLAESSSEPAARKWMASLYNNIGWACHAQGEYMAALQYFNDALQEQIKKNDPRLIRIATWCVARCMRSLGRIDEALAMQRDLEAEHSRAGTNDGFVHEEIAECLHALGREQEAQPYFKRACEALSQDPWLVAEETKRLERLAAMSRSAPR